MNNNANETNAFQRKFREALDRKGINQKKLSEISGVERSCICSYLKGKSIPKPDTIKKLALALDVDYNCLMIPNDVVEVNDFQRKFREALARKGINQRKLSEISGVETSSISCYLSGKYMPKPDTIKKLALALDV
ncbi:MAG: helix-turn-helix transcriptional regulator, partial [Clostridia bacterium]|nr:helix-turn-helix transcriptional regulator [Clostridia bacterium]